MKDTSRCLVGIYRGVLWSDFPQHYLEWAMQNTRGSYREMCEKELIRRKDPHHEEQTPIEK